MHLSRRHLFQKSLAFSAGFLGLQRLIHAGRSDESSRGAAPKSIPRRGAGVGYGPLLQDPHRILDLPAGFSYAVISRMGDEMEGGLLVPGLPDGMAAFQGANGKTIIIRNHEIEAKWPKLGAFGVEQGRMTVAIRAKLYDAGGGSTPSLGGTTTLVYDTKTGAVERQFLSLAGTNLNCSGGPTPWGAWLSCEEDEVLAGEGKAEKNHGYVFEVPARADGVLIEPVPIKAMGRFRHEAAAVDPRTSIVYMSEDKKDGLLYRYVPVAPAKQPGERADLLAGGKLQALELRDKKSWDTNNHGGDTKVLLGAKLAVAWIDMDGVDSPKNDLRERGFARGAARFSRSEGMWWGQHPATAPSDTRSRGCFYFACTTGGAAEKGQIFRYTPGAFEGTAREEESPGTLELFVEPNDGHLVENADNLTVAPWGDLLVCEDGVDVEVEKGNRLLGITPEGVPYLVARNALSESELSGVHFSPDGTTLFVNIQGGGLTLAVRGPWRNE